MNGSGFPQDREPSRSTRERRPIAPVLRRMFAALWFLGSGAAGAAERESPVFEPCNYANEAAAARGVAAHDRQRSGGHRGGSRPAGAAAAVPVRGQDASNAPRGITRCSWTSRPAAASSSSCCARTRRPSPASRCISRAATAGTARRSTRTCPAGTRSSSTRPARVSKASRTAGRTIRDHPSVGVARWRYRHRVARARLRLPRHAGRGCHGGDHPGRVGGPAPAWPKRVRWIPRPKASRGISMRWASAAPR